MISYKKKGSDQQFTVQKLNYGGSFCVYDQLVRERDDDVHLEMNGPGD